MLFDWFVFIDSCVKLRFVYLYYLYLFANMIRK